MSEKKQKRFKLKNWIWNIVLIIALGCFIWAVGRLLVKIDNPDAEMGDIFGYTISIIETDSMYPTIVPGGMAIGKKEEFSSIQTGDIIAYTLPEGKLNTHRVIGVSEMYGYVYTKGDNSAVQDNINIDSNIYKYKVVKIFNWVSELKTTDGKIKYLVIPGAILVLFIILIVVVVSAIKKRFRKKKESADQWYGETGYVPEIQSIYEVPGYEQQFEVAQQPVYIQQAIEQPIEQIQQPVIEQPIEQIQQPVIQQPIEQIQQPVVQPPIAQVQQPAIQQPIVQVQQPMVQPQVMQQDQVMYQQMAQTQPNSIASLMDQLPQSGYETPVQQAVQQPIQQPGVSDWREDIFKDIDLDDIDLDDIDLSDIDLSDISLDDLDNLDF